MAFNTKTGERMKMYNVVFDMDGVIFDSERTLLNCWLETAEKHGLDIDLVRKTYIACIGTNLRQTTEIFSNAFLDTLGEEKMWAIWDESNQLHKDRYADGILPLKEGVKEILEWLRSEKVSVGIASSTKKESVERQIRAAGLRDYFIGVIGGDAVKISKPNPEIYLLACDTFGFDPADTYAIEDSFNGIRAAKAAGMRPIMVPDIVMPNDEMEDLSECICKDLYEVIRYLKDGQ